MDRRTSINANVHSVAIEISGDRHLEKIDFRRPLNEIVANLCSNYGIGDFKLQGLWRTDEGVDGTRYINDLNKTLLPQGSILVLKASPVALVHKFICEIDNNNANIMKEIAESANDEIMIAEFHRVQFLKKVVSVLDQNYDDQVWANGIFFLRQMYQRKLIKVIEPTILTRLFKVIEPSSTASPELIVESLSLLIAMRVRRRLKCRKDIQNHLEVLLQRREPQIQEKALELLNFLVMFPHTPEEEKFALDKIMSPKMMQIVRKYILLDHPSKEMQQQLFRLQAILLRPYYYKKMTKVAISSKVFQDILQINRQATDGARRRVASCSNDMPFEQEPESYADRVTYRPKSHFSGVLNNLRSSFRMSRRDMQQRSFSPTRTPSAPSIASKHKTLIARARALSPTKKQEQRFRCHSCVMGQSEDCGNSGNTECFQTSFEFDGPINYTPKITERPLYRSNSAASVLTVTTVGDDFEATSSKSSTGSKSFPRTVSQLTVDNLKYMAEKNPALYCKWYFTKSKRIMLAEKITQMLSRLLEIGHPNPIDSTNSNYHPLLFLLYPQFLEELFCEVVPLYNRTSKEMKARVDSDTAKVLAVVQRQLSQALSSKPLTMEQLKSLIPSYNLIAGKIKAELEEKIRSDLRHKPLFVEYRQQCKAQYVDLIKKQRLNQLLKGQHFKRINTRGEKGEIYDFLQISPNHRTWVTGKCHWEEKQLKCCHNVKIEVDDIADVQIGKRTKLYEEIKYHNMEHDPFFRAKQVNQNAEQWNNIFSIETSNKQIFDFCAENKEQLHFWQDGINLIRGQDMKSERYEEELESLLDLEVRLHFLDIEGLPIPDSPPTIPPPPPNYNFHYKHKKKRKVVESN